MLQDAAGRIRSGQKKNPKVLLPEGLFAHLEK
jgi:hypothetical protein